MDETGVRQAARRVVRLEALAFGLVVAVLWLDELLDLPHRLLGAPPTPVNWHESVLESLLVVALAAAVCRVTARLLVRLRHLEGILPICSACKKIRDEQGSWHAVEAYVAERTEAEFSHGICPECMRRMYPEYVPQAAADRAPE